MEARKFIELQLQKVRLVIMVSLDARAPLSQHGGQQY